MGREDKFYEIAFFITLAILVIVLFLSFNKTFTSDYGQVGEKALVTTIMDNWAENKYDSKELLFPGSVVNYGDVEAKNVVVECSMYEADEDGIYLSETPIFTVSENIGNVASRSFKEYQLNHSALGTDDYSLVICLVKSCEDCSILDDLIEGY